MYIKVQSMIRIPNEQNKICNMYFNCQLYLGHIFIANVNNINRNNIYQHIYCSAGLKIQKLVPLTCMVEDNKGEELYSFLGGHLKENCGRR